MEKMKSTFSMWGERGLIATFFADLNQLVEPETINNFLQILEFPERSMISSLSPVAIHYIIEPDFAEFGHPDAVIAIEYQDDRAVIIVEAKRTELASACVPCSQRGQQDFNSTLNGQLELDYCLAMALSEYHEGDTELVEPEWVLSSPYKNERKGRLRRLKNRAVLEDVVSLIGGIPLDRYYFLVITNEEQNPFLRVSDDLLPELFKPELSGLSFTDGWSEYRRRFGWLNYAKMQTFINSVQNRLTMGSLFLQSLSINQRNMKGPLQGTRLIYAPQINPRTFLHFSWRNESCALRDYSRSDTGEPSPDWSYQRYHVERMIDKEIRVPNKRNVHDVSFWHQQILEVNTAYLKK